MRAHFELLAAFLIDMRGAIYGEFFNLGRQRNWPADLRASTLGGIDDLARRGIENAMIERFQPDADILAVNGPVSLPRLSRTRSGNPD